MSLLERREFAGACSAMAAALVAVAFLVVTTTASAQVAKPRAGTDTAAHKTTKAPRRTVKHRAGMAKSEVSIPVSKERTEAAPKAEAAPAPAPVPAVNQDSIDRANREREAAAAAERARQDSIRAQAERDRAAAAERARQDSIARAAQLERARQDSIARAAEEDRLSKARLGRYGFYWGLGAGPSFPAADFANDYRVGFNAMLPLGWDIMGSPLGIRVDPSYSVIDGKAKPGYLISDVLVYALNADAKLRFPVSGLGSLTRFYLLGGGGVQRITARAGTAPGASGTVAGGISTNGFASSFSDASTKFGWNAGAGVSFGFGRSAVFVESRYFSANTDSPFKTTASFAPLILGVTF